MYRLHGRRPIPVVVNVTKIEYGSIDIFLKILGLGDGSILPLIAAALETYTPQALNSVLPGRSIPFAVSARPVDWIVGDTSQSLAPKIATPTVTAENPQTETMNRLWKIINGSLFLPAALSLVVLYFAYSLVLHERESVSNEREALGRERVEFIKVVSQQNAILNGFATDAIKGSFENGRELYRIEADMLRSHSIPAPPVSPLVRQNP